MSKKIESLTEEQQELLYKYRDKWEKRSLRTDPADLDGCVEPLTRAYSMSGFQPLPRNRVFGASGPLAAVLTTIYLNSIFEVLDKKRKRDSATHTQLSPDQVFAEIDVAKLFNCDEAWAAHIRKEVTERVRVNFKPEEYLGIVAKPVSKDDATMIINDMIFGAMEVGWLGYYDFMNQVLKVPGIGALQPLLDVTEFTGWYSLYVQCAIMQDRPSAMKFNATPAAHCDNGPAIAFRDGVRYWYINGIEVDEQIVMRPETQTISQIDKEKDNDRRALRIARFGWERYLKESGANVIDSRVHPRDGTPETLYKVKDGSHRLIVVDPATNEKVCLNVATNITTCEQAQNWMHHGLDKRAMVRT